MSSVEAARTWLRARDQVAAASAVLDEAKTRCAEAEQAALDAFEREGCANVRLDGYTISLRRDLRASVKAGELEQVIDALCVHELADLVKPTVNSQSLSAYVREQEKMGQAVPEDIAKHLNVAEMFSVRAQKSSR